MTARQRLAPGSAAGVALAATANGVSNGEAAGFRWETWFAGATPEQRAEALALAREQGLLYVHQLPAVAPHHRDESKRASLVPLLSRLIAGKVDGLAAVRGEPVEFSDTQLDPLQREAVRRALNTPDLFLLQGLPGTGKSRVAAEVIVQAARRGWRVLLVAPGAAAIDVILERLRGCADVLPIRLLAPDERGESLPRDIQALTLAEQRRAFRERAVAGARQARSQAEETCARRQREAALWPQLLPLADRQAALGDRIRAIEQQQATLHEEVEREAAGSAHGNQRQESCTLLAELAEVDKRSSAARSDWQASQSALDAKQAAARKEQEEIAPQLRTLEARCRAREGGKWWTVAYWTSGPALQEREALLKRRGQVEATLRDLQQAQAGQQAAREQIEAKAHAERQDALRAETERRRQLVHTEEQAVRGKLDELDRSWKSLCATLEPAELHPASRQSAEIDAARQRWQEQCRLDEDNCQFARHWAQYLDQGGDELVPQLPALANVLAGPIAALAQGREWAEPSAGFDLLIIEDAEYITESELLRLGALAPRVMLVSQTLRDATATLAPPAKAPRSLHGLTPAVVCWPRLWQAVGDDLARLPYLWQRAGDRLICELAGVRAEDQRYLEREGLADAPEIELHILNLPRSRPVVARVTFPGQYSIPQATGFIYRELQELPIQPLGRTAWWQETAEAWVLHLGPAPMAATESVPLDGGVSIELLGAGQAYAGRAARLEFARSAMPDRAAALRWLATHLQWPGRERAAFLQVPHRMCRPLAEVVGSVLFADGCLSALIGTRATAEAHFEFVSVPSPRRPEWPREGAGLEQDLATGRHGDRIPSELRAELPRKGIVNYLEAQALVRRLEQWAQSSNEVASNGKGVPAILVLALYESQAELLRRLTARSAILKGRGLALEIAVPGQVRHRECDVLVLSMTRSHTHRCVPLGDDATDLALALTRPRQRILVFGDIGTLNKRVQWHGPLDHLDATDSHLEGQRVGRLLRHLQSLPASTGVAR
jgi:hypothetical protein